MRAYASLYDNLLADLDVQADEVDSPVSSDMGPILAARLSLAKSFFKKLCPLGNSKLADTAALEKFRSVNDGLPEHFEFRAENEVESCFWDYFRNHLNTCLGPHESIESFCLDSIREGMGAGPGAAQKADSTTFLSKVFESPMSYTDPALIRYYRAALIETGSWADAEMLRFQKFGFVKVEGGKTFFAPKNAEISRTCSTEANLNMLVQKAIGAFLETRLGWYFGISLKTQPDKNRELARLGSLNGTLGTIDLVSASDCMGLDMLQQAIEPSFLKTMLWLARSEVSVLPDGSTVKLKMISTMGNGFTFPLQTIIFASAVMAAYDLLGVKPVDMSQRPQWGVFGDDIIVHSRAYNFVCRMLSKLGFQVNVGKSFNTGPFRESCGHDYYLGLNIRGVYVKSLETHQQVYSLINRLNRWSTLHGHMLPRTIGLLHSWVRDIRIPPSEADDAGIHVPFSATMPKLDAKYWFQYRCYQRKVRKSDFMEPDFDGDAAFIPPGFKTTENEHGFAVSVMGGYIRRREIALTKPGDSSWNHEYVFSASMRDRTGARPRYQIVTRALPWWDYWPDPKMANENTEDNEWRVDLPVGSYRRWGATVVATLPNSTV